MKTKGIEARVNDLLIDCRVTMTALELYRKRAVKHGSQSSTYFHPLTFARVFPVRS